MSFWRVFKKKESYYKNNYYVLRFLIHLSITVKYAAFFELMMQKKNPKMSNAYNRPMRIYLEILAWG